MTDEVAAAEVELTSALEPVAPVQATPSNLRKLTHQYTYDHRIANCDTCPLKGARDETECLSQRPENWNGLMVVGEGPGTTEARLKVPFVGRSGQLFDRLLHLSGLDRTETYVTNATLCLPPLSSKEKEVALSGAVYSCRSRLLAEIQHLQPRVILALGNHALHTLVGEETAHTKRIPFDCPDCDNLRKWKRWGCSKCKVTFNDLPVTDKDLKPEGSPCDRNIEECKGGKPSKWQPRNVVCPTCGGKKTKEHNWTSFTADHKVSYVAGGVFNAADLPIGAYLNDPSHTYIIPTYHPSYLLRTADTASQKKEGGQFLASAALGHVKKAVRLLETDPVWRFSWREVVEPADIDAHCSRPGFYTCDLETNAKDPFDVTIVKCASINLYQETDTGFDDPETIAIDLDGLPPDHPRVQAFIRFVVNSQTSVNWQNGALYDLIVLHRLYGIPIAQLVANYVEDARVYHNAIAPDEPHDLQHIVFAYTDAPAWKPPKTKDGELKFDSREDLLEYCAKDTRGTAVAIQHMRAEIVANRLERVAAVDMAKWRLAFEMTMHGMSVDRERMLQVGARAQFEMETALREMRQFVGRLPDRVAPKDTAKVDAFELNPHSPKQLQWALFDPQGPCRFVPTAFTDTGNPSTEKTALLDFNDHQFVDALFRYKNNHKIKSVWIDGMRVHPDMRIRAKWNPIGARTGRWSSSPNLMNWQKWIRSMIVAPPGRKFVGADKAQVELRIMAALSGDAEMIRRCATADETRKLEPDHDPHSYIASLSFGEVFTSLSLKDPTHDAENARCKCQTCTRKALRDVAKRVIYGLGYGAGAKKVREAIYDSGDYEGPPITLEMVERTVRAIFTAFPGVLAWREEQLAEAKRTGRIYDALIGRYREFPLLDVDATVCYNYPIQASAASDMDMGTLQLHQRLSAVDPSAFIFAQVHDAVYVECDENRAEDVAKLVKECLTSEVRFHADAAYMPLPADTKIADNWQAAG